jgi:hypothetical protein
MVFRITCPTGNLFEQSFYQLLESRIDLQGLNPKLNGSNLSFDNTSIPGTADAFDSLVVTAKGMVEHINDVDAEMRKINEQANREAVEKFKKNQGLE